MAKKSKKTTVKKKTSKKVKKKASVKKSNPVSTSKKKVAKKAVKKAANKTIKKTVTRAKKTRRATSRKNTTPPVRSRRISKTKVTLTAKDLAHYRQLLMEKLHEILGDVDWIENEALRKSRQDASGDLSNMPIHLADIGTDNYEQDFTLSLLETEVEEVREIDAALQRIEEGTYGVCEDCEKAIRVSRLRAMPQARLCISCKEAEERAI